MERVVESLRDRDITVFLWMNQTFRSSFYDQIMPKITHLGGATFSIFYSVLLLINKTPFWNRIGIRLAISLIVSHLIVTLIKRINRRRRPYQVLNGVSTGSKLLMDASFPSGHSTAAFCTATVLSTTIPSFLVLFYSLAFLVAFSRVYLGLHYPSDITIGAGLGIITAIVLI